MATTVQQSFREFAGRLDGSSLDDQGAALPVFGDYSVATATTPPIPSFIYAVRKGASLTHWTAAS